MLPYLVPYVVFLGLVQLGAPLALRVAVPAALFLFFLGRGCYPELRGYGGPVAAVAADVAVGLGIAALWIAPYRVWPGLAAGGGAGFDPNAWGEAWAPARLGVRLLGFAAVTPFVEELFVRSFLLRWLDVFGRGDDFREMPVGRFAWRSFLLTALYFTFSHASWEWPVALPTGIVFNLWLYRRRHLGATVVAHAIANASIWAAVLAGGQGHGPLAGAGLDPWIFL
jgi:CAAX prenyl protease-like protein